MDAQAPGLGEVPGHLGRNAVSPIVPRAPAAVRTIPGTNRPWPLDKRGVAPRRPRSRFGQPLRPLDEYPPGVRAPGEAYTGPIADPEKAIRGYMEFMAEGGGLGKVDADPYAPVKAYLSARDVWQNPAKYAGWPRMETTPTRTPSPSTPPPVQQPPQQPPASLQPDGTATAEQAARAVVKTGGSATDADAALAINRLVKTVPASILSSLEKSGVKIVVVQDTVTQHLTRLKDVQPRGWPPGSTWDQVAGLYNPSTKEVVIVTKPDRAVRRLPGAAESESRDVLLHEVGHAINEVGHAINEVGHAINNTSGGASATRKLSDSDAFVAAYNADKEALRGYYKQEGIAGRDETFAEGYARFLTNPDVLKMDWPNLYRYFDGMATKF